MLQPKYVFGPTKEKRRDHIKKCNVNDCHDEIHKFENDLYQSELQNQFTAEDLDYQMKKQFLANKVFQIKLEQLCTKIKQHHINEQKAREMKFNQEVKNLKANLFNGLMMQVKN